MILYCSNKRSKSEKVMLNTYFATCFYKVQTTLESTDFYLPKHVDTFPNELLWSEDEIWDKWLWLNLRNDVRT